MGASSLKELADCRAFPRFNHKRFNASTLKPRLNSRGSYEAASAAESHERSESYERSES
jgi:hypothetical protein